MARAKKRKAKRERAHREPIIREIARLLDSGVPTRWRWYSSAHHGLRAAMCLKGMAWADADKRADEIMMYARHRIGLQWPSWTLAQGDPPEELEYWFCAGCGGFMRANSRPYCCEECRARTRSRSQRLAMEDERARDAACRVILTGTEIAADWMRDQRTCRHCNAPYTPTGRDQRFCSQRCGGLAGKHRAIPCAVCAAPFSPATDGQRYCTAACRDEAARRVRVADWRQSRAGLLRECRACGATFRPSRKRKAVCSPECVAEMSRRNARRQWARSSGKFAT